VADQNLESDEDLPRSNLDYPSTSFHHITSSKNQNIITTQEYADQRDILIESMREQMQFLKGELGVKQNTIDSSIKLLDQNNNNSKNTTNSVMHENSNSSYKVEQIKKTDVKNSKPKDFHIINNSYVDNEQYKGNDIRQNLTSEFEYKNKGNKKSNSNDTSNDRNSRNRKKIVVLGDSMVKHLDENRLSNKHNVKVHFFRGSTTVNMQDHAKQYIEGKPDILGIHCRVHDFPNKINTFTQVKKLIKVVKENG